MEDLCRDSGISKGEDGQFDLEKRLVLSAFLHMDGDKVESGSSLSSTTGLANLDQPPCNELERRRKTSQSEAEILRVGKAQARHRKNTQHCVLHFKNDLQSARMCNGLRQLAARKPAGRRK